MPFLFAHNIVQCKDFFGKMYVGEECRWLVDPDKLTAVAHRSGSTSFIVICYCLEISSFVTAVVDKTIPVDCTL